MSEPAYHLRPNKAVERALFLELLRRVDPHLPQPLNGYRYVGMGGPFLEDFRMVHDAFPGIRMISLETERHTRIRQETNQPHRAIRLTRWSTQRFLREFASNDRHLVWFDYTKAEWETQIGEACALLGELRSGSIFKVTLVPVIKHLTNATDPDARQAALQARFADYAPFALTDAQRENFPVTLYRIFSRALAQSLPDTKFRIVRPLASFLYADKSPILTITVIVARPIDFEKIVESAGLDEWEFADLDWRGPKSIRVPELSIRERISIDRWLPGCSPSGIVRRLGLSLAEDRAETVRTVSDYAAFCRYMPQFMRVVY